MKLFLKFFKLKNHLIQLEIIILQSNLIMLDYNAFLEARLIFGHARLAVSTNLLYGIIEDGYFGLDLEVSAFVGRNVLGKSTMKTVHTTFSVLP